MVGPSSTPAGSAAPAVVETSQRGRARRTMLRAEIITEILGCERPKQGVYGGLGQAYDTVALAGRPGPIHAWEHRMERPGGVWFQWRQTLFCAPSVALFQRSGHPPVLP